MRTEGALDLATRWAGSRSSFIGNKACREQCSPQPEWGLGFGWASWRSPLSVSRRVSSKSDHSDVLAHVILKTRASASFLWGRDMQGPNGVSGVPSPSSVAATCEGHGPPGVMDLGVFYSCFCRPRLPRYSGTQRGTGRQVSMFSDLSPAAPT